jgi:hypothetical protein
VRQLAPAELHGNPQARTAWAIEQLLMSARPRAVWA